MKNKIPFSAIMALVGAIVLILQSFGVKIDGEYVNEVTTAGAGLLVALGIVLPKKAEKNPMENSMDEESEAVDSSELNDKEAE